MVDETVLGFDFGMKRIGVSVGESRLGVARALSVIDRAETAPRFAAIAELIAEWRPARLVVGRPLNEDGSAHDMTARCERFANQLRGRHGLPVALVDERFSSLEADAALRSAPGRGGLSWQARKARVDAEAARIILQDWMDRNAQDIA